MSSSSSSFPPSTTPAAADADAQVGGAIHAKVRRTVLLVIIFVIVTGEIRVLFVVVLALAAAAVALGATIVAVIGTVPDGGFSFPCAFLDFRFGFGFGFGVRCARRLELGFGLFFEGRWG